MKKLFAGLLVLAIFTISSTADAAVWVTGYYRKDGTYVSGHYRSNPDSNPYNNWSYPGNTNPYTGETATGNPNTYLKNYYGTSGGSGYYGSGGSSLPTTGLQTNYTKPAVLCPANSYAYQSECYCNTGYGVWGDKCLLKTTITLIHDMQAQVAALLIQIAALQAQNTASSTSQQ